MANLVIVSSTKYVEVTFNDFSSIVGSQKSSFNRSDIQNVKLSNGGNYVIVKMQDGYEWNISTGGAESTLTVDSVDAVTPSDNTDLYNKIKAFIDY